MKLLKPRAICNDFFPKHLFSNKKVGYEVISRERVDWGELGIGNKEIRRFFCMCGQENVDHAHYETMVTIEMTWEIGAETNTGTVTNFKADWGPQRG